MFFTYDKDVRNIYFKSILRLETTSQCDVIEFFASLSYPDYWKKYSEHTKDSILNLVLKRLINHGIADVVKNKGGHLIKSLIHDENVYAPEFRR
jgi:hypothetical protein